MSYCYLFKSVFKDCLNIEEDSFKDKIFCLKNGELVKID